MSSEKNMNGDSILSKWACHDDASFHDFTPKEATEIRDLLLTWYRDNRRKLPWRGDPPPYDGSTAGVNSGKKQADANQASIRNFFTPKPGASNGTKKKEETKQPEEALPVTGYAVWVSEIMLQQTRVEAVIPYYLKWMKRFPTVHDLADASEEDVNSHWAGLGFYRRARLLHQGAKRVVNEYDGQLPQTVEGLMKIDGIGRYTASAVASIAFDACVPVVDGNVCRVLSRLRGIAHHIKAPVLKDDLGWKLAEQLVTAGDGTHAGEVNQALMELGATYCAPSGTGLDKRDPLKDYYMSTKIGAAFLEEKKRNTEWLQDLMSDKVGGDNGKACKLCDAEGVSLILSQLDDAASDNAGIGHAVFPIAPPKKAKREEVLAVAALSFTSTDSVGERWLLVKRPKNGLLAGQWEFPSACVWTSEQKGKKRKAAGEVPFIDPNDREEALDELLNELTASHHEWLVDCNRTPVGNGPIEHVFSHVRHTMWIENVDVSKHIMDDDSSLNGWTTPEGREIRWMSEADMKDVGVTAGVKKILKAVQTQRKESRPRKRAK